MFPVFNANQLVALLAIAVGAFVVGSAAGFGGGWTANGWRLNGQIEKQRADHAQATVDSERQQRIDLESKELKIGELDEELTKARTDLEAAKRNRPRPSSLSLCAPAGSVPAAQGASATSGRPGSGAETGSLGSADDRSRTVETRELYELTDEGDQAILELRIWREYAKAIGAIP